MAVNPFEHVQDTQVWHILPSLGIEFRLPWFLTKFMVLELLAAVLMLAIFIPLTRRARQGDTPRGPYWNAFEALLTFIRDYVAKPNIHGKDADRFVPFLWTLFLFILFCNLMGMFPFLGSPTANITVTGALALATFLVVHGSAIARLGLWHYLMSYIPHLEMPTLIKIPLLSMIWVIEIFGQFIRAFVLAVRLFANMFAGHTVLAVILLFIVMARNSTWYLFWPITVSSVLGVTALSLLELFVAFLQAYIFVFLAALYIGMALHPQH
jgi:F-type H+-transporting ATPase subunit a